MTRARETSENARQAKAWVNFDGTFETSPFTEANGGIRDSFNVTSVTDRGTGRYTVNLTNAMASANYSVSAMCGNGDGVDIGATTSVANETVLTSSTFGIRVSQNDAGINKVFVSLIFFGE